MVVEADGVGQVADAALDLERLAHRVEAQHVDRAAAGLGEPEHHQDGRRLARAVGPEQAEDLAAADAEVDRIDRAGRSVELQQAAGFDDIVGLEGVAHRRRLYRRPKRATAPSSTSSATAMMPMPTMPHSVEVVTVMRKSAFDDSPLALARNEAT